MQSISGSNYKESDPDSPKNYRSMFLVIELGLLPGANSDTPSTKLVRG
jgi:hypothetical protein